MKTNTSKSRTRSTPPVWMRDAAQTYPAGFLNAVVPCNACGAADRAVSYADPYTAALQNNAARLVEHAAHELHTGGDEPAAMLREAALLVDLRDQRLAQAAVEAEAASARRGKGARR